MFNNFYVYAWLKKDGSPYYIGKGCNNRAWRKGCGKVQIIASNITEDEAYSLEKVLIEKLGRKWNGTGILHNIAEGGRGNNAGLPAWNKGLKASPETIAKMKLNCKPPSQKGVIRSEETKQKIRNTLINNKELKKPKEVVTCPHCNKTGGKPAMKRFHFNRCKNVTT